MKIRRYHYREPVVILLDETKCTCTAPFQENLAILSRNMDPVWSRGCVISRDSKYGTMVCNAQACMSHYEREMNNWSSTLRPELLETTVLQRHKCCTLFSSGKHKRSRLQLTSSLFSDSAAQSVECPALPSNTANMMCKSLKKDSSNRH